MIDVTKQQPLQVLDGGDAGPYLMVPEPQLDRVRALLDQHHVRYWIEQDAISVGDEPYIVVINLGFSGDAVRVQKILDEAD